VHTKAHWQVTVERPDYDALYRAEPPPWEIRGPQPALARVLDSGVRGPRVLDLGCGTGDLAIALARRGHEVTAVDISSVAIGRARAKAAGQGLTVRFEVGDATRLSLAAAPFDMVFDSGLLHNLHRYADSGLDDYLARLPGLAAPGAAVFVLAVSAAAGPGWSLTEESLRDCFPGPAWTGTTIEATDVVARDLTLPGFLLSTVRAGRAPSAA
jgi:SAM-dependent methyltransferase